jgi:hypothetical protein
MQNDFLSSLPSIADQLGYASNDLWDFISDCEDERDPYDSGVLFTASNALRSRSYLGCTLSIGQITKWMRFQGVTFDMLIERGVAPELVEIFQEVCEQRLGIDTRGL